MNIDSDEKLDRLFAAARAATPDTSAQEQYFETRLMARIREREEYRNSLPVIAWRMVPLFVAVALFLLVLNAVVKPERSNDYFAALANEDDFVAKTF